jgi:triosephosphate isomerase
MHLFIRNKIANLNANAANRLKILYGGSVNPQNAVQLFVVESIDGGLIGKCSLNAQAFEGICRAAEDSVKN